MLQLLWASEQSTTREANSVKFMVSLSTGRIKTNFPNPLLSESDKTYLSSGLRTGASVRGWVGRDVKMSVFISWETLEVLKRFWNVPHSNPGKRYVCVRVCACVRAHEHVFVHLVFLILCPHFLLVAA